MALATVNDRWRWADPKDISEGVRVMLPSGRKGVIAAIYLDSPMLVLVDLDGRLPTDPAERICQAVCDLRVARS